MATDYEAPPLGYSASDCVLFEAPPSTSGTKSSPLKTAHPDQSQIVPMPSSPTNLHSTKNTKIWDIVQESLKNPPESFKGLRSAILSYQEYGAGQSSFVGLQTYLEHCLSEAERNSFFGNLLPRIVSLALSLPEEVPKQVPFLDKVHKSISLTQKQIGVLLANAFLCTFPDRNFPVGGDLCGYGDLPDINFNRLFMRTDAHTEHKFRCIFNYFERITTSEPDGVVTFSLQGISNEKMPNFAKSSKPLPELDVRLEGVIEEAENHLHVDFADKYVGGMLFTKGCVQEEIRFLFCPELIVTRLFTPVLKDTEALIVTGVEQYNSGSGYSRSFRFTGSVLDERPIDAFRRRRSQLVAIDALSFRSGAQMQFTPKQMTREIQKAYAGFCPLPGTRGNLTPVATGNWGCGVFRGNPRLKSLLQAIAAGEAGRNLTYFAFGNKTLTADLTSLYKYLVDNNTTIGGLTSILFEYRPTNTKPLGKNLYEYIRRKVDEKRGQETVKKR